MPTFLNFNFIGTVVRVKGVDYYQDDFFFNLIISMAVLFFLLSAGVTAIKGK